MKHVGICTAAVNCLYCEESYNSIGHDYNNSIPWEPSKSNDGEHFRYNCKRCTSKFTEKCTVGTPATCTERAICKDCNGAFGGLAPHDFTKWKSNGDGTHTAKCKNCEALDGAPLACSGGEATCAEDGSECPYCKYQKPKLGHDYEGASWVSDANYKTHHRDCKRNGCVSGRETVDCAGGEATCTAKAVCDTCKGEHGELAAHEFTAWKSGGDGTHRAKCERCEALDGAPLACSGGEATCAEDGSECPYCKYQKPKLGHDYEGASWVSDANYKTHHRDCKRNGCVSGRETVDCAGGEATCTAKAVCDTCKGEYGDFAPHEPTAWISNGDGTHTAKCKNCDEMYGDPIACTGDAATCTADGTECPSCKYKEPMRGHDLERHEAKAPTCTEIGWNAHETCKRAGCDYSTRSEIKALGHKLAWRNGKAPTCTEFGWDAYEVCQRLGCRYSTYDGIIAELGHKYAAAVTAPTCEGGGYTSYTCSNCDASYTGDYVGALSHWYGPWTKNGDGTHSATCKRSGCGHRGTVKCASFDVTVGGAIMAVCPVCGDCATSAFEALPNATAKAIDKDALSWRGELTVLGKKAPFEGALYAFMVVYEYAGQPEPFSGRASITVPLEISEAFTLVRVDVTEATETSARSETRTEIPFIYEDNKLTFETDKIGLFLLLPKK